MQLHLTSINDFWFGGNEQDKEVLVQIGMEFVNLYNKYRIRPSTLPGLLRKQPKNAEELLYLLMELEDQISAIY